jgi:hypothetical protein
VRGNIDWLLQQIASKPGDSLTLDLSQRKLMQEYRLILELEPIRSPDTHIAVSTGAHRGASTNPCMDMQDLIG